MMNRLPGPLAVPHDRERPHGDRMRMTRPEAKEMIYAALVAAALIVRAQPYLGDSRAQRRFEQIVNALVSEHLPPGMSVDEFLRFAG